MKVILHIPHRNFRQLTENDTLLWSELFNRNLANIEGDFTDLLGPTVDNLDKLDDDDDGDDREADECREDI